MTHAQIAEHIYRTTGQRVSRSSVSAALSRAGKTDRIRYDKWIPWRVKIEHNAEYPLTMLRYLARREQGLPLTEEQGKRLDSWLVKLDDGNAVVAYAPNTTEGFFYVKKKKGDRNYIRPKAIE